MTTTREWADLISPDRLRRSAAEKLDRVGPVDTAALELELRQVVRGEVRFDAGSRALYASDASNYRMVPHGVVIPRTREDVIATVAACRRHRVPIVSRAGGTGLAGQTDNIAVVLDWSKYMHRILELDPVFKYARVEPGVVADDVISAAKPHKLTWGPAPATHSHCGFGGMLGNNSCGVHAQMAGKAVENTERMTVLLYDGTVMDVGWMTDAEMTTRIRRGGREGQVYAELRSLRDRYAHLIRDRYPKLPRRVSGYNLDELLPGEDGRFNVARALVGSESTLVTILEAKVRLVYDPPERVLVVAGYDSIYEAADHISEVLELEPIGLEGFDDVLRSNMEKKHESNVQYLSVLPKGCGWLIVEFGGETKEEARQKGRALLDKLRSSSKPPVGLELVDDDQKQHDVWKVRESALGAESFVPGKPDQWPGWEDSAVRPERLGGYLRELRALFDRYDYHPALYGHFGMGCVHCTVAFDLYTKEGVASYTRFAHEAAELVSRYGGSLSGEHGDGQARGSMLPIMFGEELVQAFREYKSIWDPDGMMNPGKVVDAYRIDQNLRLGPDYHPSHPTTHFRYPEDHGSFAHATLRCVGVGKCRRKDGAGSDTHDTMCPSYMVTREEKHSTRGRARLLHEMLVNGPIEGGFRDPHVKEALDLCLSCKGCKGDCPVNVDVATYKAEFLSHYYDGRIRPRAAYAFGLIDKWSRLASSAPGLVNLVTQAPGLSSIAKWVAGVKQERRIPMFAAETFRDWFRKRGPRAAARPGARVVLWADTFNNYFMPETAQAAVEVLEHAGYSVDVIDKHVCCGRPLYDFGMLDLAKRYLDNVLAEVKPYLEQGVPIVMLEPSCASVFRDELPNLLPNREDGKRLTSETKLLSELLKSDGYTPPRLARRALVQGHCHHKSVLRFDDESEMLKRMGLDVELPPSGCCGMAGSFGFEKEKYDISIAEGERVLLPKVRDASPRTLIIADGFSCREQIAQRTERQAIHLAEALKLAIDEERHGERKALRIFAERALKRPRQAAQRDSMRRAGLTLAAAAGALALVWGLKRAFS